MERMDKLRRRPNMIRYFYLAVSSGGLHTGASYWGLWCAHRKHVINDLYVSDIFTGRVRQIPMPVENFLNKWREYYNNPMWDYFGELDEKGAESDG